MRGGDIPAHDPEGLAEGSLNDIDLIGDPVTLGNAAALITIHADSMHFIQIGDGVVFPGQIADFVDETGITIHRINGFERNQLMPFERFGLKQAFEMIKVIMAENHLFRAALADPLNH